MLSFNIFNFFGLEEDTIIFEWSIECDGVSTNSFESFYKKGDQNIFDIMINEWKNGTGGSEIVNGHRDPILFAGMNTNEYGLFYRRIDNDNTIILSNNSGTAFGSFTITFTINDELEFLSMLEKCSQQVKNKELYN